MTRLALFFLPITCAHSLLLIFRHLRVIVDMQTVNLQLHLYEHSTPGSSQCFPLIGDSWPDLTSTCHLRRDSDRRALMRKEGDTSTSLPAGRCFRTGLFTFCWCYLIPARLPAICHLWIAKHGRDSQSALRSSVWAVHFKYSLFRIYDPDTLMFNESFNLKNLQMQYFVFITAVNY